LPGGPWARCWFSNRRPSHLIPGGRSPGGRRAPWLSATSRRGAVAHVHANADVPLAVLAGDGGAPEVDLDAGEGAQRHEGAVLERQAAAGADGRRAGRRGARRGARPPSSRSPSKSRARRVGPTVRERSDRTHLAIGQLRLPLKDGAPRAGCAPSAASKGRPRPPPPSPAITASATSAFDMNVRNRDSGLPSPKPWRRVDRQVTFPGRVSDDLGRRVREPAAAAMARLQLVPRLPDLTFLASIFLFGTVWDAVPSRSNVPFALIAESSAWPLAKMTLSVSRRWLHRAPRPVRCLNGVLVVAGDPGAARARPEKPVGRARPAATQIELRAVLNDRFARFVGLVPAAECRIRHRLGDASGRSPLSSSGVRSQRQRLTWWVLPVTYYWATWLREGAAREGLAEMSEPARNEAVSR